MWPFSETNATAVGTPSDCAAPPTSVARQLPASPMASVLGGIEHALGVAIQCRYDADPRKHRRPAEHREQDPGFDCCLPFRSLML
jgi:hypothetical protein